ncbi:hypothetical protein JTE90_022947 [Oedothorax gibbosus]|uniref:Uncharacterized protein n=1 Tax=Oedothorax gibbosus TaxID=931172 RepID=A0AAV6TDD2_9ARAC|nr:hypothetical protein JTE90_022947 [Oedothorax gibbosus]
MGTDRTKLHYLLGFSRGPKGRTGHRKRPRFLLRENVPISDEPSRERTLTKKDNSSPGPPFDVSDAGGGALVPKGLLRVRVWGILTPFLSVGSETKTSMVGVFCGRRARFGRISPSPFGPTDPCFKNAVLPGTLLQLCPQVSLEYLLLPPDRDPGAAPGGLTPRTL